MTLGEQVRELEEVTQEKGNLYVRTRKNINA